MLETRCGKNHLHCVPLYKDKGIQIIEEQVYLTQQENLLVKHSVCKRYRAQAIGVSGEKYSDGFPVRALVLQLTITLYIEHLGTQRDTAEIIPTFISPRCSLNCLSKLTNY